MRYNDINNWPSERAIVTYPFVFWDTFCTEETTNPWTVYKYSEIDELTEYCDAMEMGDAYVAGEKIDNNVRVSKIKFHSRTPELGWFFDRMNNIIQAINNRWYGFDLNGYESFQYTTYKAEEEAHYTWHMDIFLGKENLTPEMHEPRKLSLSFLLNEPGVDFEGGEFEVNMGNEKEAVKLPQKKGRILAFPSFISHRVLPVTKGVRKSIVIWVTGPKFV